jgi:hypothetical protein
MKIALRQHELFPRDATHVFFQQGMHAFLTAGEFIELKGDGIPLHKDSPIRLKIGQIISCVHSPINTRTKVTLRLMILHRQTPREWKVPRIGAPKKRKNIAFPANICYTNFLHTVDSSAIHSIVFVFNPSVVLSSIAGNCAGMDHAFTLQYSIYFPDKRIADEEVLLAGNYTGSYSGRMLANLLDIINGIEKALTKRSYEEADVNYHRMPCSDEFWHYFKQLMTDRVDIEFERSSVNSVCVKRQHGFIENIRSGSLKGVLRIDSEVGLRRVKTALGNNISFTFSKKPKGVKRQFKLDEGSYTSKMTRPRRHDNMFTMDLSPQSDPTNTSLNLYAKGMDFTMSASSDAVLNGTVCIKIRFNSNRQAHAVFVDPVIDQIRLRNEQNNQQRIRAESRSVTSSMRDVLNNHQRTQPSTSSLQRSQRLIVRNETAVARRPRSDGEPHSETTVAESVASNVVIPNTPNRNNKNDEALLSSVSTSSTVGRNKETIADGTTVTTNLGNFKTVSLNGVFYTVRILSPTFYWNGELSKHNETREIHRSHVHFWYDAMFH